MPSSPSSARNFNFTIFFFPFLIASIAHFVLISRYLQRTTDDSNRPEPESLARSWHSVKFFVVRRRFVSFLYCFRICIAVDFHARRYRRSPPFEWALRSTNMEKFRFQTDITYPICAYTTFTRQCDVSVCGNGRCAAAAAVADMENQKVR